MGFIENINKSHGLEIPQTDTYPVKAPQQPGMNVFNIHPGDGYPYGDVDSLNKVFENLPIVYRCISLRARAIASLPLKVFQTGRNGKMVDISDKDLAPVITRKPNPSQTRFDFIEESSIRIDSQGELFWRKERGKNGGITGLYADWISSEVKIQPDKQRLIGGFERMIGGQPTQYEPEDVFFLKYTNPNDVLRGLSPLRAAQNHIVLQLHSITFLKKFYKSGMAASGVFGTDQKLNPDTIERFRSILTQHYSGIQNMHKFIVAHSGLKFQSMDKMSLNESEIMPLLEMDKAEIADTFGIPLELVNGGNRTYENMPTAMKFVWEQTLIPHLEKIQQGIECDLLPELVLNSDNAVFRFWLDDVPVLKEDREKKRMLFDAGYDRDSITPNEYRQHVLGLEILDKPHMDLTKSEIPNFFADEKQTALPAPKSFKSQFSTADLDAIWQEKADSLETVEDDFYKEMIRFFNAQEKEVLKQFGDLQKSKGEKVLSVVDAIFDFERWKEELAEIGDPIIVEVITSAAEEWLEGEAFNATDPTVRFAIGERLRKFSEGINDTTKRAIQDTLRDGFALDESIEELKDRIKDVFEDATNRRARLIARTEAVGASNFGTHSGLQQGKWPYKTWITSRDPRVRCSHKIDGQTVPIDGFFLLASGCKDSSNGKSKLFPDDFNERCFLIGARRAA